MKASLLHKLESLAERHAELSALLSSPEVIGKTDQFRNYSKEYAELTSIAECFGEYRKVEAHLTDLESMRQDPDPQMRSAIEEEIRSLIEQREALTEKLQQLLLPRDPDDDKSVFLEIRAGAGGDEASIFAGDLFRMYSRYADAQGWNSEVVSSHESEKGGYKEIIVRIAGRGVYGRLKFESGVHRVQRVPETEAQGRIHTSTCTVAVLPEAEELAEVIINPADLKIDTYRASGAGGQHVNRTDSAIRITHLPSGIVVECQDERSQHKNRARAMSVLSAKLNRMEKEKQQQERAETRRNLVGSGDRSERIRTYNFPQGRMTDHRIQLTLYQLEDIMQGNLNPIINALSHEYQADQLAALQAENE